MNNGYRKILIVAGMTGLFLSGCQSKENDQVTPAEVKIGRAQRKSHSLIFIRRLRKG